MQTRLIIGVGQITLLIRHAQSLKDKRQVLKSAQSKLRNEGWSVVECGFQEDPRKAVIGFSYAGKDVRHVEELLDEAFRLFQIGAEAVDTQRDVFDYSETKEDRFVMTDERWADEDDQ